MPIVDFCGHFGHNLFLLLLCECNQLGFLHLDRLLYILHVDSDLIVEIGDPIRQAIELTPPVIKLLLQLGVSLWCGPVLV